MRPKQPQKSPKIHQKGAEEIGNRPEHKGYGQDITSLGRYNKILLYPAKLVISLNMDPIANPFSPGAGTRPSALVGRDDILEKLRIGMARTQLGRPEKNTLLIGLRGVGKTVLLAEAAALTKKQNIHCIRFEAHDNKALALALLPHLQEVLFNLERGGVQPLVRRAFRVLKSFLNVLKIKYKNVELSLDIEPERGLADSGDLEIDLPILLQSITEAMREQQGALVLIIDELQYCSTQELSALIMAAHRTAQDRLPLLLIGAGLPQLVGLVGRSKSYAERMFDFPLIGALTHEQAIEALQQPVQKQGARFDKAALSEIIQQTKAYPYFLQEWGYQAWNLASTKRINLKTIQLATQQSLQRLDEGFFCVRFDRITANEKKYIYAMAQLGRRALSRDIAKQLNTSLQKIAPTRDNLIKKGMIYSPSYGEVEFSVPLFNQFINRTVK